MCIKIQIKVGIFQDESIFNLIYVTEKNLRFIPIFVSEPIRIIPNQSEKRFVSRLMKNGKKSMRPNPI